MTDRAGSLRPERAPQWMQRLLDGLRGVDAPTAAAAPS
jgi:hypothetical protein